MAYEHREGQGSLFKNDKKNERQPDFKETVMIKGVLYNISAWSRTSQNGREYISLQAEEKTEEDRPSRPQQGGSGQRPSIRHRLRHHTGRRWKTTFRQALMRWRIFLSRAGGDGSVHNRVSSTFMRRYFHISCFQPCGLPSFS